ncbi:sugar porter family MFS transporter [Streptomyces sp. RB6PN25]|uniref:Sugar porter family MFS transporter n=1 Tax=Streptomyces humicola TaxID=2953240 RepID=A0ABT1Q123_9ACTN|nr:sugar porter family MFS transporter [Streptomyces humicola]MCQ4083636.1 sugar porter family MFS transporter [Streptomyces humicola]
MQPRTKNALIWVFGALGGILWGYDTGVISGAMLFIKKGIHLTPLLEGMVVSGLLVGAMLGAGVSGKLSDSWGRRKLILAASGVFILGTLGASMASDAWMLIVFRFTIGIGVGIASVVVPLYLTELAPKQARGGLASLMQLLVTVGIFLAYVVDYLFSHAGAWRWMIGIGAVPATILAIGIITQPESPRWLVGKGRNRAAGEVLAQLRGDAAAAGAELAEIEETVRAERKQAEPLSLRALLSPRLKPVFVVGMLLVFFQNFVGINTIIYYAPTLLTNIGFGSSGAILATGGVGLLNMLMTLPAMRLIDRKGRKPLLLFGALGMCAAMTLLAAVNLSGLGYGVLLSASTLFGIGLYIASFAVSWGPVQWVMLPELFPMRIRAAAVSLCVIFNWLFNMIVALVFPSLLNAWGAGVNFLFFAVMTFLAYLFTRNLLPETKGRSLEEIEQDLLGRDAIEQLGPESQSAFQRS